MEKKECCIGIDVSKNTLDIAIFDGGMDWNKHIQERHSSLSGIHGTIRPFFPLMDRRATDNLLYGKSYENASL